MNRILKIIFNISLSALIIISLWPGSLVGYIVYNDWGRELDSIIDNFFITNHFIAYLYVSFLGFFLFKKNENFKKLVYGLFILSLVLELLHLLIPNRNFQIGDLASNFFGVIVAYFTIKIYLLFNRK
jgi:VanZ family protein